MNYEFPYIEHIDQVLPAIENYPEFLVIDKEDYIVINYAVNLPGTFARDAEGDTGWKIRRECRGLIFDPSGKLISRRFHKFFNLNEREETQSHVIDFSQPHEVFQKLDGSMITPIPLHGGIRWGTKMGITDVGLNAEYHAYLNKGKYNSFAKMCIASNITPIFEWLSRKNRIVIDYPLDELNITAIRETYTGRYLSYEEAYALASPYVLPVNEVLFRNIQIQDVAQFVDEVRTEIGIEGYVIRFHSGHMLKLKSEEYCLLHKSKDVASSEHNIIQAIVDEKIDDLKSLLFREDLTRVLEIEERFWNAVEKQVLRLNEMLDHAMALSSGEKKTFAIEYAAQFEREDVSMVFQLWDGRKTAIEIILDHVRKNVTKQMKYEEFKSRFYI